LSTSETDFDRWITAAFAERGAFTAFAVLVQIGEASVTPLCSTYFNVIGEEIDWGDITVLFAGAGAEWDGASFFPATARDGGPLDNPSARLKLRDIEMRLDEDPLVLNEGHFFDKWGRRLRVDEVTTQ
jgi:hypothetical protein